MYGTSFSENVIAYYLSKVTEVKQQAKFGKWSYDVFLPKFNTVIEYDGVYFHQYRKDLDERKSALLKDIDITLIKIKEDKIKDNYVDGDIIYVKDGHLENSRFQFALDVICRILSLPYVNVNLEADTSSILAQSSGSQKRSMMIEMAPELIAEWDFEKNGDLKPEMVSACSHFQIWWTCKEGHSYSLAPVLRTRQHQGCPYCAGKRVLRGYNDLSTNFPMIASEWHPKFNGNVTPDDVMAKSNRRFYWKCCTCGHEWVTSVCNRTVLNRGCPECGRKKRTGRPKKLK